jgi:hypothetical protein
MRIGFNGTGIKPSDSRTLPLCYRCHHRQHTMSEKKFWSDLDIDPIKLCDICFDIYSNTKSAERCLSQMNKAIFLYRA